MRSRVSVWVDRLRNAWRDIKGSARVLRTGDLRPDLPDEDAQRLREKILDCLEGPGGEVSARARSADLGRVYLALNDEGRARFLTMLAAEFGTNPQTVDTAIEGVVGMPGGAGRFLAESRLRDALMPPRRRLLTQFTGLPNGVKFLVDMRAEALGLARRDPELNAVAADLGDLFATWFDVGFLDLERITWPRRRRCSKSSSPTKRSTRSTPGTRSRSASPTTGAVSPSSIRACPTSR